MSDNGPQQPSDGMSKSEPAEPAKVDGPAAPETNSAAAAPQAASTPQSPRWLNLAIAVVIVTGVAFVIGRSTATPPPPPAPPPRAQFNLTLHRKRLSPAILRRLRMARPMALAPASLAALRERAAVAAQPGHTAARLPRELPQVARAMQGLQPQVQACFAKFPHDAARPLWVRYRLHVEPGGEAIVQRARVMFRGGDAHVRGCVQKALRKVRIVGVPRDLVGTHAFDVQ